MSPVRSRSPAPLIRSHELAVFLFLHKILHKRGSNRLSVQQFYCLALGVARDEGVALRHLRAHVATIAIVTGRGNVAFRHRGDERPPHGGNAILLSTSTSM